MRKKYGLSFINDVDLYNHVAKIVEEYSFNIDLKKFNSNIIDPIKLTFDSVVYGQDIDAVIESEVIRQLDKTNSNSIGYFHQNIFKYFGRGWDVPEHGYDIVNVDKKIYCELKNKHNTMNSSSGAKTYMRMQNTLLNDKVAQCYLVEVIASNSQDIPWIITLDGEKQPKNDRIRRISIDKFYALVTGVDTAFVELCKILPTVVADVVAQMGQKARQNSVVSELTKISPDRLTSLYMLAFKKYEGFTNFNLCI